MRPSIYIVLFFLFFNGGYVMAAEMGVWDHLGMDPNPGGADEMEQIQRDAEEFNPGDGGVAESLFSLITTLFDTAVQPILDTLSPGFSMLKNVGVLHPAMVTFLQIGTILATIDAAAYLRGFNL